MGDTSINGTPLNAPAQKTIIPIAIRYGTKQVLALLTITVDVAPTSVSGVYNRVEIPLGVSPAQTGIESPIAPCGISHTVAHTQRQGMSVICRVKVTTGASQYPMTLSAVGGGQGTESVSGMTGAEMTIILPPQVAE